MSLKRILMCAVMVLMPVSTAQAADLCIQWDASTDTVEGYRVYESATSGPPYENVTDVGNVLTWTDTGIAPGEHCYVVTAYAAGGSVESAYSNEVCESSIPAPPGGLRKCTSP